MTRAASAAFAALTCIVVAASLALFALPLHPMRAYATTSAELQVEADALAASIDALQTKLNEATAEYERASTEYETATAAAEAAALEIEETQKEIDRVQERLSLRAEGMYKTGGTMSFFDVVLGASSFDEFLTLWDSLQRISEQDAQLIQESKDLRAELEAQKLEYETQREKAAEEMENARVAQEEIAASKASLEDELSKMTEEIALLQAQEEEARIAAEEAARRAELAQQAMSGYTGAPVYSNVSVSAAGWTHPCPGYSYISSLFGEYRGSYYHNGVDLAAGSGVPIYAAAAGTVSYVGWWGGGGNTVIIAHGNGAKTLYMHQSQTAASVGQAVEAGQLIGYVGTTGDSTGPHLHFQLEINGTPVNPGSLISL